MTARVLLLSLGLMVWGHGIGAAEAADPAALVRVLQERRCSSCQLQDADLVHADLRDADLKGAQLQRANLSQTRLEGADLRGADLSFTSLRGANLRGANLEGARLYGTDLRESDLSGTQLSAGALEEAHWEQATGIAPGIQSHASLHNAGVDAALQGRWPAAEQLFSNALLSNDQEVRTWIARGITRSELAKDELAANDFRYAATLYAQQGDQEISTQLMNAAQEVSQRRLKRTDSSKGNGWGGQVLSGLTSMAQALAPLAIKALVPIGMGF